MAFLLLAFYFAHDRRFHWFLTQSVAQAMHGPKDFQVLSSLLGAHCFNALPAVLYLGLGCELFASQHDLQIILNRHPFHPLEFNPTYPSRLLDTPFLGQPRWTGSFQRLPAWGMLGELCGFLACQSAQKTQRAPICAR